MQFAIVNAAAAPVRKEADHRSEMVNQLLFGETVKVLKRKNKLWVKVQSLHDGYEGWMTSSLLEETDELTANMKCPFVVKDLFATISNGDNRLSVPAGASLPFYAGSSIKIGQNQFTVERDIMLNRFEAAPSAANILQLTKPWLGVPYLWGGRTPMGIDCSGFTQVIFKQLGIDLPRDAWQQAEAGEKVNDFSNAKCGDLVFFGKKGRITHVGILLENGDIIHSSGKVRIDNVGTDGKKEVKTGGGKLKALLVRRTIEN